MARTTNDALGRRLLGGDQEVLEEILLALGPPIRRRVAHRYRGLLRPDEIEDIVLAVVERVWTEREEYDPEKGCLGAWVQGIANHVALEVVNSKWCKRRKREVEVSPSRLATFEDWHSHGPAGEEVDKGESLEWKLLSEALAKLPERQRYILLADACSPEGKAVSQDLARELNISSSAVRVYRKRVYDKVRAELERRGLPGAGRGSP
jgi:RNA polymerase sigma factor (sigma-70 family)